MRVTITGQAEPMLREAALSDLFFNYDHPEYDKASRDEEGASEADLDEEGASEADLDEEGASEADLRACLDNDARAFIETLERATGLRLESHELVNDFMRRV